jgi:hypothetical protein
MPPAITSHHPEQPMPNIDHYLNELMRDQPFEGHSQAELLKKGLALIKVLTDCEDKLNPLLEPLSYIWSELIDGPRKELNQEMSQKGLVPIRWLAKVKRITNGIPYTQTARGRGHVYFILLDESQMTSVSKIGLYIGQSVYSPQRRFENHRNGINASRHVHNKGKFVLQSLSYKFKPISNSESKRLEKECLKTLRAKQFQNLPAKLIRGA